MSIQDWLGPFIIGMFLVSSGAIPDAAAQGPTPVKREILALYDGGQEGDADLTRIHRFAELPLSHMGFILKFHDVREKLPDPATMDRYRGVLTWFMGSVRDHQSYVAWASRVSRMDLRYVLLGDIGVPVDPVNLPVVNRLMGLVGLRHTGQYIAPTVSTRVVLKHSDLVEYECRLGPVLPTYPIVAVTGAGTRVGLMLESPNHDGKRRTALVAISDRGGFAAANYEFCHQRPPLHQGKWMIDPFAFLGAALGAGNFPVPDTTTVAGRRLYFSRLASDGWTRSSKIEGFREKSAMAAEGVIRELVETFPDLPTTIDVREGGFGGSGRSSVQARLLLQRILASANVDVLTRRLQTAPSRFDLQYPSLSNLFPLRSAADEHVAYTAMSDESAYYIAGPVAENGFLALKETARNTESPRRLKPFNVNYHAYAGEYPALLSSVKEQLGEARRAALAPISANRFATIVDGFFATRIDRVGKTTWRITNRGALQTVRFDEAQGIVVDLASSIGVIGQRRIGQALYVALDETIEPAVVVINLPGSYPAPTHDGLALIESRWLVRNVANDKCALTFEAQGYGDGAFSWSGATARHYIVAAERQGVEVWRQTVEPDGSGNLDFVLPVKAIDPVMVRVSCAHVERLGER